MPPKIGAKQQGVTRCMQADSSKIAARMSRRSRDVKLSAAAGACHNDKSNKAQPSSFPESGAQYIRFCYRDRCHVSSLPAVNVVHTVGRNQIDGDTVRAYTASLLPCFHVTVASRCAHKVAPSWRGFACNSGASGLFSGAFLPDRKAPETSVHAYLNPRRCLCASGRAQPLSDAMPAVAEGRPGSRPRQRAPFRIALFHSKTGSTPIQSE